jgi:uncharacterized protein YukE
MTASSMPGLGDANACEQAANDCERAARQLDSPISRLTSVRGVSSDAWQGSAGESLVGAIDTRRQDLVQAQRELQNAAARLRSAAAEIRDAIRRAEAERARRERDQRRAQPAWTKSPLDLRV